MTDDPEQLALLDALQRVEAATDHTWRHAADHAIATLIRTGKPFTSRDVWQLIPTDIATRDNRAMGPVIRSYITAGLIRDSGQQRRSGSHKRGQTVWQPV